MKYTGQGLFSIQARKSKNQILTGKSEDAQMVPSVRIFIARGIKWPKPTGFTFFEKEKETVFKK